jgi:hypothetical protein
MMVRRASGENLGIRRLHLSDETPIEPDRDQPPRGMGPAAWPDIPKSRQQRWPDEIAIAEDRRGGRQHPRDLSQLPAIEHLAMRQVDVGDAEPSEL